MSKVSLSISLVLLYSTTFLSSFALAEPIEVNNWQGIQENAQNYGSSLKLTADTNANRQIKIGQWDSSTKGSWSLDGGNHVINASWQPHGFSIENNINAFVFKNLNFKNVSRDRGPGGVFYNSGGTEQSEIIDSFFDSNDVKNTDGGGVLYNNATVHLINNSKFSNNYVNNARGSVIYNNGKITTISNNTFDRNGVYD